MSTTADWPEANSTYHARFWLSGRVVDDKWYLLDLQLEPGYVILRLNNREEARHETNIPVEMVDKGWVIQNIDAAIKTLHIDYYLQRLVTYADARF